MKKLFLLSFFIFFILSGEASAQDQQTPENYLIKYSGAGLPDTDSLILYSKPGMFKIEEYFSIERVSYQKVKYLLGKHLTTIDIRPERKQGNGMISTKSLSLTLKILLILLEYKNIKTIQHPRGRKHCSVIPARFTRILTAA